MIDRLKILIRRVFFLKTGAEKNQDRVFRIIASLNLKVSTIIDIGANHGTWSRNMHNYFPDSHYVLIEPNPILIPSIKLNTKALSNEVLNVGVSDRSEKMQFMISTRDDSSRFGVTSDKLPTDFREFLEVDVITLDELNHLVPDENSLIIKIDAEGLDLCVLKGGGKVINKADIVFIEAAVLNPDYENDLASVVAAMSAQGFSLLDVSDMNRTPRNDMLWLMELCFAKTDVIKNNINRKYI